MPVVNRDSAQSSFDELCDCIADEGHPVYKQPEEEEAPEKQKNVPDEAHGCRANHSINNSTP
jgi:hypothetical protein